jgi:hypothetical protein
LSEFIIYLEDVMPDENNFLTTPITEEDFLEADIDRFITVAGNFGIDEALEFWRAARGEMPPPFGYGDIPDE